MLARSERWGLGINGSPFSEFSMPMIKRELHFLKMTWLYLFPMYFIWITIPCMFQISPGIWDTSLLSRDIKVLNYSYPQFVPLKNVWGKLMHIHALGGFDMSKISWNGLLLVSIWSPRVVLPGQCWEICMLEMRKLKIKVGVTCRILVTVLCMYNNCM